MSDTILAAIVGAVDGIITDSIGSLFAPWTNWGIEKRREQLAYRRELIRKWRVLINNLYVAVGENKRFGETLILQEEWPSLKAHLSPEVQNQILNQWYKFRVGVPDTRVLPVLADEIGRIEKQWGLV